MSLNRLDPAVPHPVYFLSFFILAEMEQQHPDKVETLEISTISQPFHSLIGQLCASIKVWQGFSVSLIPLCSIFTQILLSRFLCTAVSL